MSKLFQLFYLLLLLIPFRGFGQQKALNAVQLRRKAENLLLLAGQTAGTSPDKAIKMIGQAKLIGESLHDTMILAKSAIASSELIYATSDLDRSTRSFGDAFRSALQSGDSLLMFSAARNMLSAMLAGANPYEQTQLNIIDHFVYGGSSDSIRGWARYEQGRIVHNNLAVRANAAKYFRSSIRIATEQNDGKLLALSKSALFNNSVRLARKDSSDQLIFEAMEYFKKHGLLKELAMAENSVADHYRLNGNFAGAASHYRSALQLSAQIHDQIVDGIIYLGLVQNSLAASNYDLMLQYIQKTEAIYSGMHYPFGLALMQNFRGKYHAGIGERQLATVYYDRVDSLNKTLKSELLSLINFGARMTKSMQTGEKISGDSLLLASLNLANKIVPRALLREVDKKNAQLQTISGIPEKSRQQASRFFLDSSYRTKLARNIAISDLETVRYAIDSVNASTGLPKSLDSLIALSNSHQLAELETRYGVKQKSDSLKIEIQAHQIAESKLDQRNKMIGLSAVFTAILLGFLILLLRSRSRLRASNANLTASRKQLSDNYDKIKEDQAIIERLQGEINHRVDNNFAVVRRFVEKAAEKMQDPAPMDQLRCRIYNFELLHEQLYSENRKLGMIGMQYHLTQICYLIKEAHYLPQEVAINIDADVYLEIRSALKIGIIVNELVTNSFKYAFNEQGHTEPIVSVTLLKQDSKDCYLIVQDNGPGVDTAQKHITYGFKLIKGTASELNAKFSYGNADGARFEMTFTDVPKAVKAG